ncbi:DUF4249 family protein [Aquimarina agarivorans]|uniref:DUF4249 family protein n=1 Tax=Aquimarina agarivorans TaxID=980584 RepID=UPI000248EA8B|nr:DUF4249 family protein [Aquimarina agarivorans]
MKKISSLFIIFFALFGCEEVIDVDLPKSPARLVINAALERVYETNNTFEDQARVRISFSTPFFSTAPNYVENASVSITHLNTGQIFNLLNTPFNEGLYKNAPSDNLVIDPNSAYKLTVVHNNITYESTEQLNPSTPIDSAVQVKRESDFDTDEFAVEIKYTDIPNMENFYVFDFGWGNLQAIEHEDFFQDGAQTPTTQFFEEIKGDVFKIRFLGSDKRFHSYVNAIIELSGESSNGPFATTPFDARGNIANTTDPDDFPFGYFRVNEVFTKDVSLIPNNQLE